MSRLTDALDARFTDLDECKDVANYGCIGGVSDYIYSTELAEFFDKHEDDIEDTLEALDIAYHDLIDTDEFYSMQEIKEKAVWVIVEDYCQSRVLEAEELVTA
jgi:hypothetical protein